MRILRGVKKKAKNDRSRKKTPTEERNKRRVDRHGEDELKEDN